jgi:hypothetical protein
VIDWLKQYFSAQLRLLAALARFVRASRQRMRAVLARPLPVLIARALMIVTAVAWLLVALLGDGRQGERLDKWFDDLRQTSGFGPGKTASPAADPSLQR